MARWAYSKSGNPLRIVTCMSGNSLRTAASSASPSAPGMQISVNRISGRFSRSTACAASPSDAVAATSQPYFAQGITFTRPLTMISSSSTIITLYILYHHTVFAYGHSIP